MFERLLAAIARGDTAQCRRLLRSQPAVVGTRGSGGITALHTACAHGLLPIVYDLITMGADVNAQTHAGDAPLHGAVFVERADIVRLLRLHGARTDVASADGITPGDIAMAKGNKQDMLQALTL